MPIALPGVVKCSGSIEAVGVSCRCTPWGALGGASPAPTVNFAKPKSRIFAWPRVVTKILDGLMSR